MLTLGGVAVAGLLRESSSEAVATTDQPAVTAAPATDVPSTPPTSVAADVAALEAPTAAAVGEEVAVPEGAAAVDNAVAAGDEPDGCTLATRELVLGESGPERRVPADGTA